MEEQVLSPSTTSSYRRIPLFSSVLVDSIPPTCDDNYNLESSQARTKHVMTYTA